MSFIDDCKETYEPYRRCKDVSLDVHYSVASEDSKRNVVLTCELMPEMKITICEIDGIASIGLLDSDGTYLVIRDFPCEQLFKLAKALNKMVNILGDPYKRCDPCT